MLTSHNVVGAYSSAGGNDFREVLSEIVKIKDEALSVPMPEKDKWRCAGEIVGDGFSVAWRTLDAQHWGVAQRRRRCYLVADFTGERAGKILFESEGVSGYTPPGGGAWQGAATDAAGSIGEPGRTVLNDQGGSGMYVSENMTGTLRAEEHGHQPLVFEPGAASRLGAHVWDDVTGALRADMGDNQLAVAIPINMQIATRHKTLGKGTGFGVGESGDPAFTLQAAHSHAVAIENHPADSRVKLDESGTVQTLTGRMGTGGGNVPLIMNGPRAYGISSVESNGMKSPNLRSGYYEADTSRTIDVSGGNPACNQGGIAVCDTPEHYTITTGSFTQVCREQAATLTARDYKDPQCVNQPRYAVRRLTPRECAMLQGFPPDWCSKLETTEPTEADIAWWSDVFETHRKIMGKSGKAKSRNQIIKWLREPHSDSAEYKMWGNGVSLPIVCFVMAGIVWAADK